MNLLKLLPQKAQDSRAVAALIEKNAAEIVAARAALPALKAALDEASLRDSGDAAALSALRSAEHELDRLEHRAGLLALAKIEADALAEKQRIEAVRARAVALSAALDKVLAKYGAQAEATAAAVAEIEAMDEELRGLDCQLTEAGAETVPRAHVDEITRKTNLPAAVYGEADHRARALAVNPALIAVARRRDEAAAAHVGEIARLKNTAVRMILRQ